jgi:hypothetical protein
MRVRYYFLAIFLAIILVAVVAMAEFHGYGRSVKMNMAFHIGASKSDDALERNDTYVFASDGATAGMIFSGSQDFGTEIKDSGADYSLQLKQSLQGNEFYVLFTQSDKSQVLGKIAGINKDMLLSKTFGDFPEVAPKSFPVFIRLDYYDIDLLNKTEIGRGDLVIKNEGRNERGMPIVSMVMRR